MPRNSHSTPETLADSSVPITSHTYPRSCDYLVTDEGTFRRRRSPDGQRYWEQLANFSVEILQEECIEDGGEVHRIFTVKATINGQSQTFDIEANDFFNMKWPIERLGASAVVYPQNLALQHMLAAIQLTSQNVKFLKVYGHTGWVREGDNWNYLHAGGAIGAEDSPLRSSDVTECAERKSKGGNELGLIGPNGPPASEEPTTLALRAVLPQPLQDFRLPKPGPKIRESIDDALFFLQLGPARIVFPLFSAVWLAILGGVRFGIHIVGRTGTFKTEIAALLQQFFGATMNSRNLKGSWSSTANALEAIAYLIKDGLLVVDDFAPTGASGETSRLNSTADRLIRSAGNSAGRARSNSMGHYRPGRHPRALLLSTGEEVPDGHSARARMLIIQVEPGSINATALSDCQCDAISGKYAETTSAFIAWLAGQYGEVTSNLESSREQWRREQSGSSHRRVDDTSHDLQFGFDTFLWFARDLGAITDGQLEELSDTCRKAILEATQAHQLQIEAADPVEYFLELLAALLAAKKVHFACWNSFPYPSEFPEIWGYRRQIVSRPSADEASEDTEEHSTYVPGGVPIGWTDGFNAYLNPYVYFAQVQALATQNNSPIPMKARTLEKRLADGGIIERDPKRKRIQSRITVDGVRLPVLMIPGQRIQWVKQLHGVHKEDEEDNLGLLA